jgi:hypothetical protein
MATPKGCETRTELMGKRPRKRDFFALDSGQDYFTAFCCRKANKAKSGNPDASRQAEGLLMSHCASWP